MACVVLMVGLLQSGCVSMTAAGLRTVVPESLVEQASVDNLEHIRYWGDGTPEDYRALVEHRIATVRKVIPDAKGKPREINFLSLSGGGSDGAFGAGLLVGWTETGKRPKFDCVTGISTGAMMAPLAFLGPKYDQKLKEAYTTLSTDQVAQTQVFAALVGAADSLADTTPLKAVIARFTSEEMLQEIAEEHRKGRVLLIGTTNLDAQRSVIWDIGALAASGHPDSLALMRQIILASAAIPGAFPPVEIKVTAGGKSYSEMHVDGGVTRQVFMYPPGYTPKEVDKAIGWKAKRHVYIIRNAKLAPEFLATKDNLVPIATRSIDTLIKTQGVGDLYRIYSTAIRDGVDYNLAYIPVDFTVKSKDAFDKDYMNALFDKGYELGRSGYQWHKAPPGLDPKPN